MKDTGTLARSLDFLKPMANIIWCFLQQQEPVPVEIGARQPTRCVGKPHRLHHSSVPQVMPWERSQLRKPLKPQGETNIPCAGTQLQLCMGVSPVF